MKKVNTYNVNYYAEICRDYFLMVILFQNSLIRKWNQSDLYFSDPIEFINDELFLKMNHPYYLNRNFVEIGKNEKVCK
jgi:hypothetical protein